MGNREQRENKYLFFVNFEQCILHFIFIVRTYLSIKARQPNQTIKPDVITNKILRGLFAFVI